MKLLSEALDLALSGETLRSLVVAPPGVGKSRLVNEFVAASSEGSNRVVFLRTRCLPEMAGPFEPVAQLTLDALGVIEPGSGDSPRESAGALLFDRLAASHSPARAHVITNETLDLVWAESSGWTGGDVVDSPRKRDMLFTSWLEALDALAGGSASVWLVEDAHWAGGDLVAFLDAASAHKSSAGRLVLVTARPSILERTQHWAADDASSGRFVLYLSTLSDLDSSALVEALIGKALPPHIVELIVEQSDGNPLFIEELLRTWIGVGTLVESTEAGWRLTAEGKVSLPTTVQAIYAAQIDDLPARAREVTRCGSVAGRRFAFDSLGPLGATDPSSGIEVLDRRALIAGPQLESPLGATYSFRHALLREAAYAGLARSERARMHVRLARWIETTAGDQGGEFAEIIGGHYASALASAPGLAGDVGDEVGRTKAAELAASWFERAGSHALAGAAHDAARDLFRRSLDLTSEQSPIDLARRWQRLGEATAFAAHMDEGAECFRQATVLYLGVFRDEASTAEDRATARTGYATASDRLGSVSVQQLRFREAIRIAQEALEVVGERNDLENRPPLASPGVFDLCRDQRLGSA